MLKIINFNLARSKLTVENLLSKPGQESIFFPSGIRKLNGKTNVNSKFLILTLGF